MNLNTICNKNSSIEETVTSSPPSLPSSQRKLLPAINTMATSLNNTNSTHSAAATTTTSDASNSLQKTTTVTASTNKLINHHQEECLPSPPNSNNSIPVDENHLTFMINRTIDILNILNGLKSEFNQARNEYENDSELMRKQKAIITDGNASQSSRLKYRKRNKRAAPPGRCHSCDISETPEWRRGPDGARTLCNACGLRMCFLYFLYLIEK
ncbi:13502_t:CDS:2 [Entrophospora sp. SA101]|nr:13502_t:CDS:2 [Entrophospora sp. SA101]